jgi:hypothetical protein
VLTSEIVSATDGVSEVDATEVAIGAGAVAKIRNPVQVGLFDLLTVGIYGVIWYAKIHGEFAVFGRLRGTTELGENPKNSWLALFPGLIVIVPAVITLIHAAKRLRAAQTMVGIPDAEHVAIGSTFALLLFLPPVGSWYFQKRLNEVWQQAAMNAESAGGR